MSIPKAAMSARDEVRQVAPKLIEMTEKAVCGASRTARQGFDGAAS